MTPFDTTFLKTEEITLSLERFAPANPEKKWVDAYHFLIVRTSDGVRVGRCDVRIGQTQSLFFGGNIGYTVFPEYRGHGYAGKACKLLFVLGKKHKMSHMYITCDPENLASDRTLQKLQGEFIATLHLPEDNAMYTDQGKRFVNVYRFMLG